MKTMKTTAKPAAECSLQELTCELTAFPTWTEFSEAMTERDYLPTLRAFPGRSRRNQERTAKVGELIRRLRVLGYQVWTGS